MSEVDTSFDLNRFVEAQEPVIDRVLAELRAGCKQSHWMWFIFPQLKGLGMSPTAQWFGIPSRDEAAQYLAHPVVGARLVECTRIVNELSGTTAENIFGALDAMKFRSSMTLFAQVAEEGSAFHEALTKYFDGQPDRVTLVRLG